MHGWKRMNEGNHEKKMTEGIIPSDVLSYIEKLWFKCYEDAESCKQYAKGASSHCFAPCEEQDWNKIVNGVFMECSDMNANFAIAYRMIKNTMEAVNIIIDSFIEKLEEKSANKDEVLSLRKELTSKVIETLAPINEEIRKRKERDEHTNNTEHITLS